MQDTRYRMGPALKKLMCYVSKGKLQMNYRSQPIIATLHKNRTVDLTLDLGSHLTSAAHLVDPAGVTHHPQPSSFTWE